MELTVALVLLILAGVAFVLEGLHVAALSINPKWWAIGVALYLFSLAAS